MDGKTWRFGERETGHGGGVRAVGARLAVLSCRVLSRVSCRVGVAFRRGGCGAALRVAKRIFCRDPLISFNGWTGNDRSHEGAPRT